jgi:hypothetical protein
MITERLRNGSNLLPVACLRVVLPQRHDAAVPAVTRPTLNFQTIMNRRQFLQLAAAAATTAAHWPPAARRLDSLRRSNELGLPKHPNHCQRGGAMVRTTGRDPPSLRTPVGPTPESRRQPTARSLEHLRYGT